ncbi:MAG: hypothetical protein QOI08_3053 [Actinomycetota bacterium]|nr:hypothetical protein [Actinomycetota bacterium]
MAPVLQCPDCGEKHPIGRVPASGDFPCKGCGRTLKVPDVVAQRLAAARTPQGADPTAGEASVAAAGAAAAGAAAAGAAATTGDVRPPRPDPAEPRPVPIATAVANPNAAAVDPASTRAIGNVQGAAHGALPPRSSRRPVARLGPVPWWMRFLVWIVAVPVSFVIVFLLARSFGLFTSNQLSDLFLASNTSRFWPAARLLPFVALVTAALVQGGVFGLARMRGRRSGGTRAFEDLSGSTRATSRPRATS